MFCNCSMKLFFMHSISCSLKQINSNDSSCLRKINWCWTIVVWRGIPWENPQAYIYKLLNYILTTVGLSGWILFLKPWRRFCNLKRRLIKMVDSTLRHNSNNHNIMIRDPMGPFHGSVVGGGGGIYKLLNNIFIVVALSY